MKHIKRVLAIMLVLTMMFSLGEEIALASGGLDPTMPAAEEAPPADDVNSTDPENTDEKQDVDPGAGTGDGGKVTTPEESEVPEENSDAVTPPEGEPSAPPADTDGQTEGQQPQQTEPTATPEPTAVPEPTATPEPAPEASPEPVHKEWPWTEPGNTIEQLMGGGYALEAGDSLYYSENGGLYLDDTLLASVDARNLNLCDGMLYYTEGSVVYRMPSGGGAAEEVYAADSYIEQMYVMGEEIRFLSGGVVYSYDMSWTEEAAAAPVDTSEEEDVPAADPEQDAPPADTEAPVDDAAAQDVPEADEGVAPAAALPGTGLSLNMDDLGLEPSETETEIVTGETQPAQPDSPLETLEGPAGVAKFLPTPYGNLFLVGSNFSYTLWTATAQVQSDVWTCYPDGEWLVVFNTNGDPMQTSLADIFSSGVSLQEYSLHQDEYYNVGASDEEILEQQAEYFASDEFAATLEGAEPYTDNGIMTVSTAQSAQRNRPLTSSQRNIVLRARQMSEVTWTPLLRRYAWGGNNGSYVTSKESRLNSPYIHDINNSGTYGNGFFLTGHTYRGVPYSQPVWTNGYVGYGISVNNFLAATKNSGSKFYTAYSDYSSLAPYYGSDCSAFVSWAWGISRNVCSTLDTYSTFVSSGSTVPTALQVGDILNNPSSHVMLVTDIGYDASGNIVSVEITEETPPKMTVTCYGPAIDSSKKYDYVRDLSILRNNYLSQGYTVYHRKSSLPDVTAPETVQGIGTVSTPTITVTPLDAGKAQYSFGADAGSTVYYTDNGTQASTKSTKYSGPVPVDADILRGKDGKKLVIQAIAEKGGTTCVLPLNAEINLAVQPKLTVKSDSSAAPLFDGTYYVEKDTVLSLKAAVDATIHYTTDGSIPSMTNGQTAKNGEAAITMSQSMTVKAFAEVPGDVPSEVVELKVEVGSLHTITVDDPFEFLTLDGTTMAEDETNQLMRSKQYMKDNGTVKITVDKTVKVSDSVTMTLDGVEVTRGSGKAEQKSIGSGSISITNVTTDLTVRAKVKTDFTDIYEVSKGTPVKDKYAWFANAVEYGAKLGLINGNSDGTFKPYENVTRGQFMAFLGRLAQPEQTLVSGETYDTSAKWEASDFPQLAITVGEGVSVRSGPTASSSVLATLDMPGQWMKMDKSKTMLDGNVPWYYVQYDGSHWGYVTNLYSNYTYVQACTFNDFTKNDMYAYGYSQWGNLIGIVSGTYPQTFSPRALINREDLCCLLYKYVTYLGIPMDTSKRLNEFADGSSVRDYAEDAVNAMINAGILNGKPSQGKYYICPRGTKTYTEGFATRAEAATMFMRLDKYLKSVGA